MQCINLMNGLVYALIVVFASFSLTDASLDMIACLLSIHIATHAF